MNGDAYNGLPSGKLTVCYTEKKTMYREINELNSPCSMENCWYTYIYMYIYVYIYTYGYDGFDNG